MTSVLGGTLQKAGEVVSGALSSNQKIADMEPDKVSAATSSDFATTDFGVKIDSHDIWLSASTGDRKGPQLLEDNVGREKVRRDGPVKIRH